MEIFTSAITARTESRLAMPTCGHRTLGTTGFAGAWAIDGGAVVRGRVSVKTDATQAYAPGHRAWSPPSC